VGPPSPSAPGLILLLLPAGPQQLQLPGGEGDDGARAQLGEWHRHPWQSQPGHPPHLAPTSPNGKPWSVGSGGVAAPLLCIEGVPSDNRRELRRGFIPPPPPRKPSYSLAWGIALGAGGAWRHAGCWGPPAAPARQGQGDKRLLADPGEAKFSRRVF